MLEHRAPMVLPKAAVRPAIGRADPSIEALDAVMHRYVRGEDGALSELYRQGAPRVYAFVARLCADLALADDLTQEAFLRISNARGSFVVGAPALPWMLAIARNVFRDHIRRERVRRAHRVETTSSQCPQPWEASHDSGERVVGARQLLGLVQATLMTLPVRQREAFVLMRFEGLSITQAAAVLGATESAVKFLVFRAYTAIRAALDAERSENR
jgi:RNA polymerase sigma-70 factor (ECF subfamily)